MQISIDRPGVAVQLLKLREVMFSDRAYSFSHNRAHPCYTLARHRCPSLILGAMTVWILPEGHNVLGTIFVDPDAQDQGVGTRMWQFIQARYPQTKSWRLATPRWATKNHYFYAAKCGFERVESDPILGSPEDEFVYRKDMLALAAESVDLHLAAKAED